MINQYHTYKYGSNIHMAQRKAQPYRYHKQNKEKPELGLYTPNSHIPQTHSFKDVSLPNPQQRYCGSGDPTTLTLWEDVPTGKLRRRPYWIYR